MKHKIEMGIAALTACFAVHSLIPAYANKWINPKVIKHTPGNRGIMLTFDDGPDERYTGSLLDLLAEEQVHASFFLVLSQVKGNEALIGRMIIEGHRVAFHSRRHQNAMLHSGVFVKKELEAGRKFLEDVGEHHYFYRPPWGLSNLFTWFYAGTYGMKMILWSAMAGDWKKDATVSSIIRVCKKRVRPGTILCLHDAGEKTGGAYGAPQKTIRALRELIPYWKGLGYEFVLPE